MEVLNIGKVDSSSEVVFQERDVSGVTRDDVTTDVDGDAAAVVRERRSRQTRILVFKRRGAKTLNHCRESNPRPPGLSQFGLWL